MSDKEQLEHFADDVDKLVHRYRMEYDISFSVAISVLQMKIFLLCQEAAARGEQERSESD